MYGDKTSICNLHTNFQLSDPILEITITLLTYSQMCSRYFGIEYKNGMLVVIVVANNVLKKLLGLMP